MEDNLKILFVTSECDPFVKTGGLADIASALPQAIKAQGHDIRVVMPEYEQIDEKYLSQLKHVLHYRTRVSWRNNYVGINKLNNNGLVTYFVDNENYFHRATLYDSEDKHIQFAYFCRAVLEMLPKLGFKPDIIHCNDWHTGPLSMMLKENYREYDFYQDIKTVYTIHNLKYQGEFGKEILDDVLCFSLDHWETGVLRHDGLVNYMKMGVNASDIVTTVSETYAQEIKTPEYGEGLDYAIRMNEADLYGIVNGIDYQKYNPATDDKLYVNYDVNNLAGKSENKKRLQEELGLPARKEVPVVGLVSRLVEQKGLDLISEVIDDLLQEDVQVIILGTGNKDYEDFFREKTNYYPEKLAVNIKYDDNLARRIYAGSDIFLMPSKYEPCGLAQLISLRYGTIPVVRETGGLNDTIYAYNEETGEGNGFSFTDYNAEDMLYTIRRAIDFYHQPEVWKKIINNAMNCDFSWENSAQEYIDLYYNILPFNSAQSVEVENEEVKTVVDISQVNINSASVKELKNLKGVGPALAKRIIGYRKQQDGFADKSEIKLVSGIGQSKYNDLKDKITV